MTEAETKDLIFSRVSSESVREATGQGWEEWLETFDAAGAADWDHKEIVAYPARARRRHVELVAAVDWQREGWPAPATLQLTLSESGSGKTTINAHLEKLPDAGAREAMRERWREALERIAAAAA
jgi:hypothetical protein